MIELNVEKMKCGGCSANVERVVKSLDPEATVKVDLTTKRVQVEGQMAADVLVDAISKAGYPAQLASPQ
ncbi:MAG TPA: heavy metal-associated domain-containing protein [Limnobacter sp.]|nr:heavy metal-associated domain-containing protein [Limnobacter sp.]